MRDVLEIVPNAEQRYYYGVVLSARRKIDAARVRQLVPRVRAPSAWTRAIATGGIEFLGWRAATPLGSSAAHEVFRVSAAGAAPEYHYDFFLVQLRLGRATAVFVGFPMVELARATVDQMVDHGLLKEAEFVRPDVKKVVVAVQERRDMSGKVRVSKLVSHVEDEAVSRLVLGGSDAVHSRIYKLLLKNFGAKVFKPRHCVLAFGASAGPAVRMHIDNFGNFRFWMRSSLTNISVVPEVMSYIQSIDGFSRSSALPYERIEQAEGDDEDGS